MKTWRILAFFLTLVAVLVLPWWISAIIILFLMAYFPLYIESVFFGVLVDTVYSPEFSILYSFGFIAMILLVMIDFLKKYIRT